MTALATIVFSNRDWLLPTAIAAGVLAAAMVWTTWRSIAEGWVKVACAALKVLGVAALAVCLLEPLWVGERARPGANLFAVIADNSQGLQIKDAGESLSRGEQLRETLAGDAREWRSSLEDNFQVRRYTFDARLQSTRDFAGLDFSGRSSALGHALRSAIDQWKGQPFAGVLLFTDGNATDIGAELPALDGSPPIYPVVVGSDSAIRDLSLRKTGVSQTAFEDAPVTVQADVRASGFGGSEVVARLVEVAAVGTNASLRLTEPKTVAQLTQKADADESDLAFRFQLQPEKTGLHFYQLEVTSKAGVGGAPSEATLVNNRQMVVIDRGQEPFRILYVGGRPNWEYKFLNRAIQEDPQVQMVALIRAARREPKFEFKGREGESSNPLFRGFDPGREETARYDQPVLVRLNTKDEFELRGGFPKTADELFRYHAVILDDIEAEFFTHDQMALLQRFVSERGGGFLMLGGIDSFREGNYGPTPIASMLPVYVDRSPEGPHPQELKLTLTREGWLQPWTRLRSTEAEERTRLNAMPEFEVLNRAREIKPGATVLSTVTDAGGKTHPALAVQRFGHGRSAALMIGDLWRWGMRDENVQTDLARAWRQLARWLVADVPPRVAVATAPLPAADSGEVQITVKARDEEFKPLDNAAVRLTVRPVKTLSPGASNQPPGAGYVQINAEPSATEPGAYTATFVAREAGAYSVDALVTRADGKIAGRAAAGWTSDPAAEEFRSLKPNRALLQGIAQRTGGEVIALADLDRFVRNLPSRRAPITETWSYPLWHKPMVFLLVIGCFVMEWGLRRWKGLP